MKNNKKQEKGGAAASRIFIRKSDSPAHFCYTLIKINESKLN